MEPPSRWQFRLSQRASKHQGFYPNVTKNEIKLNLHKCKYLDNLCKQMLRLVVLNLSYMQIHRIPILYCPFVGSIHPQAKQIEEHTLQWLLDFKLVGNYETFLRYKKNNFPLFIARTFPHGAFIDICTWCDLNSLLFIVDDFFDANDLIKDKSSFDEFRGKIMSILLDNIECTLEDGPVFAAFTDIWERLRIRSSATWQMKFIGCIKQMFEGLYWQFKNIHLGIYPPYDEYLRIRQFLGASHLSTDSLELTGNIFLSDEVYQHPVIARLTEISRNIVCYANDLFSLSKERMESQNAGEYNLVGVIKRKFDLTWDEAIKRTADFHDDLMREFIALVPKANLFDLKTNEMINFYIDELKLQMIANIEWSTQDTDRYPHIYGNVEEKLYSALNPLTNA
jgi:terpene synthase-like protein